MRFTGVCLLTDNVPKLAFFYEKVLLAKADCGMEHAAICTRGGFLSIHSRKPAASAGLETASIAHSGSCVLEFAVDDVDAEYNRLRKLGVLFSHPPVTDLRGTRSIWFQDPEGNPIHFLQPMG